jgi:metal-dependent hydrolase (beta-lactamase superfamily II)
MVLLSHNHYDHLDVSTLRRLAYTHRPRIATPLGVRQFLEEKGISGLPTWIGARCCRCTNASDCLRAGAALFGPGHV